MESGKIKFNCQAGKRQSPCFSSYLLQRRNQNKSRIVNFVTSIFAPTKRASDCELGVPYCNEDYECINKDSQSLSLLRTTSNTNLRYCFHQQEPPLTTSTYCRPQPNSEPTRRRTEFTLLPSFPRSSSPKSLVATPKHPILSSGHEIRLVSVRRNSLPQARARFQRLDDYVRQKQNTSNLDLQATGSNISNKTISKSFSSKFQEGQHVQFVEPNVDKSRDTEDDDWEKNGEDGSAAIKARIIEEWDRNFWKREDLTTLRSDSTGSAVYDEPMKVDEDFRHLGLAELPSPRLPSPPTRSKLMTAAVLDNTTASSLANKHSQGIRENEDDTNNVYIDCNKLLTLEDSDVYANTPATACITPSKGNKHPTTVKSALKAAANSESHEIHKSPSCGRKEEEKANLLPIHCGQQNTTYDITRRCIDEERTCNTTNVKSFDGHQPSTQRPSTSDRTFSPVIQLALSRTSKPVVGTGNHETGALQHRTVCTSRSPDYRRHFVSSQCASDKCDIKLLSTCGRRADDNLQDYSSKSPLTTSKDSTQHRFTSLSFDPNPEVISSNPCISTVSPSPSAFTSGRPPLCNSPNIRRTQALALSANTPASVRPKNLYQATLLAGVSLHRSNSDPQGKMHCSKRYLGPPNGPNSVQSHEVESGTKQKANHPGNVYQFGYSGHGLPPRSLDGRFAFAVTDSEDAFVKDSIDLGEARLINIRTGSFFGRIYEPHKPKSPDLKPRKYNADQGLRSSPGCQFEIPPGSTLEDYIYRNNAASPSSDKAAVQQAQPQRGNNQKPVNLAPPSVELDPVLALLEDDVDQLDRFRNQFRDEGVRSHKKAVVSGKGFSSPRAFEKSEIRTDDKESLNGQVDQSDCENLTQVRLHFNGEDLNETSKGLNNQINELIELEFRPRSGLTAVNQKSATLQPPNHATADQAKSELHLVDLVGGETKKLTKHLLRDHPFRWSAMEKRVRSSPYHTVRQTDFVPHLSPPPVKSSASVSTSVGTHSDSTRAPFSTTNQSKKETDGELQALETFAFLKMDDKQIKMFIRQNVGCTPLWIFSAKQLTSLRKIALMQLISTQERLAGATRILKWPLFKNRVLLSAVGTEAYQDKAGSSEKNKAVPDTAKIPKPDEAQRPTPIPTGNTHSHPEYTSASLSTTADATCLPTPERSGLSGQENTFTIQTTAQTTHFGTSRSFGGSIFGQPLRAWTRRVGYPFPPCITNMLEHLQQVGHMAPGIFRRAGGRLRIQALRDCLEKDINWNFFADWQPYDVADVVKQYFRELPECLLTNKLSANLIHIYSHSNEANLSLLRWAIISLPDENRIALQSLLYCLNGLANRSSVTQMGPNNLAICFTPTLFHLSKYPRRRRWGNNANGNDLRELDEQNAAQKCLCAMITNAPDLFMISEETLTKCHLDVDTTDIPALSRIISGDDLNSWLQGEVASFIKESAESKSRSGWTALSKEALKSYIDDSGAGEDLLGFEIAFKLPAKKPGVMGYGSYLRTWRCSLIISGVGVSEVFDRFWNHRASWDESVLRLEVLEQLSDAVHVQRLLFDERAPQPARECRLLRGNLHDPKTGVIAIVSQSVNHGTVMPDAPPELLPTAHFFKEHTLLEPLHQGTSCCITVISQVDLKGFSTDWYTNHWGHFLLRRLLALRHSFTVDSVNCANQTTLAAEQERKTSNK